MKLLLNIVKIMKECPEIRISHVISVVKVTYITHKKHVPFIFALKYYKLVIRL